MNQKDHKTFPLLIASDHAGFDLKTKLIEETQFLWKDLGCFSKERTDYPDWADKLCSKLYETLQKNEKLKASEKNLKSEPLGVLICGTGQGMAMRANRWKHIRAGLCWNEEIAFLARSHNQANVLCLPGKFMNKNQAQGILNKFLTTEFNPETAYKRRVEKLEN